MAPTTNKQSGSNPDKKKGCWIMSCFGFGSKRIKKDSTKVDENAVPEWGESTSKVVQLSDDHIHQAIPLDKLLLIDPEKSQKNELQKRDGIEKSMKQFDQVSKTSYGAKFGSQSSLDGSKLNQMNEPNGKLDSHSNCSRRRRRKRLRSIKLEGDAIAAMSILMVILTIMLLCGRLSAILCTSICFYCWPLFTKTTYYSNDKFDSEAYKRKVVLEEILARSNKMDVGIS